MKKEKLFSMLISLLMVVAASVMGGGMAMAVTPEGGDDTEPETEPDPEPGPSVTPEDGDDTEPEPAPDPEPGPSDTELLAASLVNRRKRRVKRKEAKRKYRPKPFMN